MRLSYDATTDVAYPDRGRAPAALRRLLGVVG